MYLLIVLALVIGGLFIRHKMRDGVDLKKFYDGKVVVITGASSGIGRELAHQLAGLGSSLLLVARREDRLIEVKNTCLDKGAPKVEYVIADLQKENECKNVIDAADKFFKKIDVLVLNAGQSSQIRFDEVKDLTDYRGLMETNYWSNVALTKFGLPFLQKTRGNICVISSLAGKIGPPLRTGYSPTKWALHGFYNSLRTENGNEITITIVCPGFVSTELHQHSIGGDRSENRNLSEFMPVDEAALITLKATARGDREEIMTLRAKLGVYFTPFIPGVLDMIAIRLSKEAFNKKKES